MKKIVISIVIILVLHNCTYSQNFKFGFTTGIGTYSMSDLKIINDAVIEYLPFDTKIVSDFPPYLFYQPKIILEFNTLSLGLVYTFQSTGSRISGKDYSGEYRFDMKVNSHNPGIYAELGILSKPEYKFSVYSNAGLEFSNLKINEYLNLEDSVIHNYEQSFKAMNYYVEPGIIATHTFTSKFSIGINAGYLIEFGKNGFYKDKKENELLDPSGHQTKPNWNGFRFGATIYYTINKKTG